MKKEPFLPLQKINEDYFISSEKSNGAQSLYFMVVGSKPGMGKEVASAAT